MTGRGNGINRPAEALRAALATARSGFDNRPEPPGPIRTPSNVMARWPRHFWTTLFTYGLIFVGFPLLCWLAYAWVRGSIF
jgi:hypothetical protein